MLRWKDRECVEPGKVPSGDMVLSWRAMSSSSSREVEVWPMNPVLSILEVIRVRQLGGVVIVEC